MQNIMNLKRRGYLTDQQVFHAHKFSVNPNSYNLAPTFHRVLYDVIIKEEPLEALEKRKGWPARSAKALVGLILYAMQEIQGSHLDEEEDENGEGLPTTQEQLDYLKADNGLDLLPIINTFGFTGREARLFLILKRAPGMQASKEALLNRLYADQIDEAPSAKILDVFICKMRKKLEGTNWRIETIWGAGYRLHGTDLVLPAPTETTKHLVEKSQRNIYWYKCHVYDEVPMRELARESNVAPSTVMRVIHGLTDICSDEELSALVEQLPADYTAQKERTTT